MAYDGRDGAHGDFTQVFTSDGTQATGHELHSAGVNTWDTAITRAEKLATYRTPLGVPTIPGAPAAGSHGYSTAPLGLVGGLLMLIPMSILALIGFIALEQPMLKRFAPAPPTTEFSAFATPGDYIRNLAPAQRKDKRLSELQEFSNKLGHLFRPGTSFAKIFDRCAVKTCVEPDYAAIQSYKRFALNPATFDSDLCRAKVSIYAADVEKARARDWKLVKRRGQFYECQLADRASALAEYRAAKQRGRHYAYASSGAIILAGFFGLYLLGRKKRRR